MLRRPQQSLESRVLMWSLLGPLIILLALTVGLVKADSDAVPLACLAAVGVGVCWKWKMAGLWGVIASLVAYIVITYGSVAIEERFWHVGMTMVTALAMVITTLSMEEVEAILAGLRVESESRLEMVSTLDEKLKKTRKDWSEERRDLTEQIRSLAGEVDDKERRVNTFERVIGVVRQDLESSQKEHDALLEELFAKRCEAVSLQQRLNKSVGSAFDGVAMVATEEEHRQLNAINDLRFEVYQLEIDKQWLSRRLNKSLKKQAPPDIAAVMRQARRAEGMYNQLREQFEEKGQVLDEARKELFAVQEKSLAYEREAEEAGRSSLSDVEAALQRYLAALETEKQQHEKDADAEVGDLHDLVSELLRQLSAR